MQVRRVVRTGGAQPGVEVWPSRVRQWLLVLGALLFVLVGVAMITSGDVLLMVVGVVAVVVFGAFGVLALWLAVRAGPALSFDTGGITDRSSATSAGHVPWSEVTGLSILTIGSQRTVTVHVRDPEAVLARAHPLARRAMRASMRMSGSPVNISTTALPLSAEELVSELAVFVA